ncbi:hypothetical protein D1007_10562 [Hordeum vulgare]|nr:hypothetical protein D1007_10562 [Hordeum vulgare]
MDKSRGSSSEAISGSKRRRDKSRAAGADLEYEASLRSQLEAARADREQVARDREAWAAGPEWLQQDERVRSLGGSISLASGSGTGAAPMADPWEVAAVGGAASSQGLVNNILLVSLPGTAVSTAPTLLNVAVISMQRQKITPQVLLEGLRVLAVDGWDWHMHQISDFEFSVVFPSCESLRMIASCTSFTLPLNQLAISVKVAMNGFKSVGELFEVWVLVEDVPAEYRSVPFLMAFGILLGKPIEVDGESLADVFPSFDGIRLRVRLEGAEAFQAPPPPPPPTPSNFEKRDDGSIGGGMNPSGGLNGGTDA